MRRVATSLRLLRSSLRRRGVRGTLKRARRLIVLRHEEQRKARADRRFDEVRGVDTATWVRVPELDTDSPNREHAMRYQPSSVDEFALLMGKLDVDHETFTFVDYGSGKGRVLMLAAAYPFKRIIGVEFVESLDRIARQNVATLGADAARIETVVGDAASFDPPPGPLVLYFFNPFDVPVLRPVLERVRASLENEPRPTYIVIVGPPKLSEAVEEAGFDRVDVDELGWLTRGVFAAPAAPARTRRGRGAA